MKKINIFLLALIFCFLMQSVAFAQVEWKEINRDWVEIPLPFGDFENPTGYSDTQYGTSTTMRLSSLKGFGYLSSNPLFTDGMVYYSSGTSTGIDYDTYPQKYDVVSEEIIRDDSNVIANKALLISSPVTKVGTIGAAFNCFLPKVYLDTGENAIVTASRRYKISYDYKFNGSVINPATGAPWGTASYNLGIKSFGVVKSRPIKTMLPTVDNGTVYKKVEEVADASDLPAGTTYLAWYLAAGSGSSVDKLYVDNFKSYVEGTTMVSDIYFTASEADDSIASVTSLDNSFRNSTIYAKLDVKDEIKSTDKPIILFAGLYRKESEALGDGKLASEIVGLNVTSNMKKINEYQEKRRLDIASNITKVERIDYSLSLPIDLSVISDSENLSDYEVRAFIWNGFSSPTNLSATEVITGQ